MLIVLYILLCQPVVEAPLTDTTARAVITDLHGQPIPETVPLGDAVVFSARKSVHGGQPQSIKWTIQPPDRAARQYVSPDGMEVFVPTGIRPTVITVILSVAKDNTTDHALISVRVGHGPQPPPDDPTPASLFKAKVAAKVKEFDPPSPQRAAVAAAWRAAADALRNGQIKTLDDLLKHTMEGMVAKTGYNDFLKWVPLRDAITVLLENERLPDLASHAAAWYAIADAIEGK